MERMGNNRRKIELLLVDDTLFLKGSVNYDTVMLTYEQGLSFMQSMKKIQVDFTELEKSDSSILALLIEWIRWVRKKNQTITFFNIPKFVQDLSKACGVNFGLMTRD